MTYCSSLYWREMGWPFYSGSIWVSLIKSLQTKFDILLSKLRQLMSICPKGLPCRQIILDQQRINEDRLIQCWFYVYSTVSAGWVVTSWSNILHAGTLDCCVKIRSIKVSYSTMKKFVSSFFASDKILMLMFQIVTFQYNRCWIHRYSSHGNLALLKWHICSFVYSHSE